MPKIHLNLGCGLHKSISTPEITWINIDKEKSVNPDLLFDLEKMPLPYHNDSIDRIYASHILEHLHETEQLVRLMEEIWRICKSGARMEIYSPHGLSEAGIADPTHHLYLCAWTFKYFDKTSKFFIYDYKCNFKMISESRVGWAMDIMLEIVK